MRNLLFRSAIIHPLTVYFMQLWQFLLSGLLMITMLAACKKDKMDDNTGADPATPVFGDGTLVATRVETLVEVPGIGTLPQTIGTAVAVFSNNNFTSFVDGGSVKANDMALTKQSNNSYVFVPDISNPLGLDFSAGVTWDVAGNAANGVSAFQHTPANGFPSTGSLLVDANVSKSGFTLELSSVSNADSVYFSVNDVVLRRGGNVNSITFTAADLQGLSTGTVSVSVSPWSISNTSFGGKNYYFINQVAVQRTVNLTD
jgi:hypothetical protein